MNALLFALIFSRRILNHKYEVIASFLPFYLYIALKPIRVFTTYLINMAYY